MVITPSQKFWLESGFILELLKQIPASVFWKDTNSVYLGCNDAFAHSVGLSSPEEIIGKTDYDLPTTKEESDAFRADDRQVMQSKQAKLNIEECQTTSNGKKVTLLTNKVPLLDNKKNVIGILGIYHDITERKVMEQRLMEAFEKAEEANIAKTGFLLDMRHDIRTPLSGMIGLASLLMEHANEPDKVREYGNDFVAASNALLAYLNKILEAIKASSCAVPILKQKFNLKKTLEEIVSLMKPQAKLKKIDLELHYDKKLPRYFMSDGKRIHRIALELISNALKFTEQGFVKISVSAESLYDHHLILRLVVEDSGVGVPKEIHQEMFTQFKKLTPSYKGIYKGLGLGLSIIKEHIELLEGEIYLDKERKKGSQFTCLIPLQIALLQTEEGCVDEIENFESTSRSNKFNVEKSHQVKVIGEEANLVYVLLVEDDGLIQMVSSSVLSSHGCKVDIAATGEQALELAGKNDYDLIFMDLGLPGIDGCEAARKLRAMEISVPIAALTAHGDDEHRAECMNAGINIFINKVNFKDELPSILKEWER
jgi:PAS domain S-box-containing protein